VRAQMAQVRAMMASGGYGPGLPTPRKALADHRLLKAGAQLMGVKELGRDVE